MKDGKYCVMKSGKIDFNVPFQEMVDGDGRDMKEYVPGPIQDLESAPEKLWEIVDGVDQESPDLLRALFFYDWVFDQDRKNEEVNAGVITPENTTVEFVVPKTMEIVKQYLLNVLNAPSCSSPKIGLHEKNSVSFGAPTCKYKNSSGCLHIASGGVFGGVLQKTDFFFGALPANILSTAHGLRLLGYSSVAKNLELCAGRNAVEINSHANELDEWARYLHNQKPSKEEPKGLQSCNGDRFKMWEKLSSARDEHAKSVREKIIDPALNEILTLEM